MMDEYAADETPHANGPSAAFKSIVANVKSLHFAAAATDAEAIALHSFLLLFNVATNAAFSSKNWSNSSNFRFSANRFSRFKNFEAVSAELIFSAPPPLPPLLLLLFFSSSSTLVFVFVVVVHGFAGARQILPRFIIVVVI